MEKSPRCNLEFVRDDDYVEYFIFPNLSDKLTNIQESSVELEQLRVELSVLEKQCMEIVNRRVENYGYIWHRDEFKLQMRTECAQERLLNNEVNNSSLGSVAALPLPPHLHGISHYGENIEDEWFIVHLLYELTRKVPGCIARVIDADGEFLLVEAAEALPTWANPESCEQRVYIADGHMHLVQNSPSTSSKLLSVGAAVEKIRQSPSLYRVSKEIQNCINERTKAFNGSSNPAAHRQIMRLPLGVAALLKTRPSLIAPAVRAFCERDAIDLKVCRSMRYFPPEQCVRTNVLFTRCLYAMLMHTNYKPDRKVGWVLSNTTNTKEYKEQILGIKIACGFEILASQAKCANQDENDPNWRSYVKNLTSKGYFRNNIEGSEVYKRLWNEARTYFTKNNDRFRTAPLVGLEILNLLQNVDISAENLCDEENNLEPSDADDWLNISADQLDAMLIERYGPKKMLNSNGDINAAEFTKNLADFLDKESTYEGIDDDDIEDSDSDCIEAETSATSKKNDDPKVNLKKNHSLRKACNRNSVINETANANRNNQATTMETEDSTHVRNFLDFVIPEDKWESTSEMSDYEDDDKLEHNFESMANSDKNIDSHIKNYMDQMDKELANTTIGQTFEKNSSFTASKNADDFDDIESFQPININVNTLKNIVDSYKSQLGGSGPVSNLLSAMGVGMSNAAQLDSDDDEADVLKESRV
ncbi:protein ecdysoneless-like [Rhagoletis pomonella]|uniref:protein ecdysoneless-like n=1 Tax=Rhagoletis pomonella TaxID=28610 RepID=UPI00177EA235|nr:protein ecdysoneless-like [Rhagoletis pomonella]